MSDVEFLEDLNPTVRSTWMARVFVLNTLDSQWTYNLTRRRRKTLAAMGFENPHEVPRTFKVAVTRVIMVDMFERLLEQRPDEVRNLWERLRTIDPSIPPLGDMEE